MPLKPHPTDPDKMVYESRKYNWSPPAPWVNMMRGVRVEGETVIISAKGGNDGARELCAALIEEMNK